MKKETPGKQNKPSGKEFSEIETAPETVVLKWQKKNILL
jgi:hypothetical protein